MNFSSHLTSAATVMLLLFVTPVTAETTATKKATKKPTADRYTTAALADGKVAGVKFKADIHYLEPGRAEKLDLYQPGKLEPGVSYPAIVMIHGGGWVGGKKDARREVEAGVIFARSGYVVVSAEYMKEAGKRWPTNVHDCKNAVRWLRANAKELQVDPDRIGVIGGSAGGHLALMVAYTSGIDELEPDAPYPGISSHVSACIDLYGITNPITRQRVKKDGTPTGELVPKAALFAESREEAPEKWKLASPVHHVSKDVPPTLILHGTADGTVDRDQAHELAKKLEAAGADYELRMIKGGRHSFTLIEEDLEDDIKSMVLNFFDKHLK